MNRPNQLVAARQRVVPVGGTYEGRPLANPDEAVFDQGLAFDLETSIDRRQVLKLIGYAGLERRTLRAGRLRAAARDRAATATAPRQPRRGGAAQRASVGQSRPAPAASAATAAADCAVIPEETAGPFPGDGSNGPDVLSQSGVVRTDIRSSFGEHVGHGRGRAADDQARDPGRRRTTARRSPGRRSTSGTATATAATRSTRQGVTDENYLRGVQEADATASSTFTSIFPACYSGRWPHIHFEVYPNLAAATDEANKIATSQIALPEDACDPCTRPTATARASRNLQQVSLATDNVFGDDGGVHQLGPVSGSVADGYIVELTVPVSAS